MKRLLIFITILTILFISCVDRYDKNWVPIKSYKCKVIWNNNQYLLTCQSKEGNVFSVEMRHHHYYSSELRHYLYINAPCEVYVFKDTITNQCYYRLYKQNTLEAHTQSIVKIK